MSDAYRYAVIVHAVICCALVNAQNPEPAVIPMNDFQATGSASGWAWGDRASSQGPQARTFHLWRVNEGKISDARLPAEISKSVEDLVPGVSFLDDEHGFIVWTQDRISEDSGVRFTIATAETTDGARSWRVRQQSVSEGFTFTGVNQLQFIDSQHGHLIVGTDAAMGSTFKTLFSTTNGGKSWKLDESSETVVGNESAPIHMLFRSATEGWILRGLNHGQSSPNILLFHTTDGGTEWQRYDKFASPRVCQPDCSLLDVGPLYFDEGNLREGMLWAYFSTGDYPGKSFQVRYRTHDGGGSWSAPERFEAPGRGSSFADLKFGVAQHEARFFLTRDGGHTWPYNRSITGVLGPYKSATIKDLHRREHALWLVAGSNTEEGSLILISEDDGSSWRALSKRK